MPWNLFLLPVLGGYYILTKSYFFKFTQQRLDKQRLIFSSVTCGVVNGLVVAGIRFVFEINCPSFLDYIRSFILVNSPQYLLTSIITFLSAVFFVHSTNLFINKDKQLAKAVHRVGDEMELLFLDSKENDKPLLFTLNNNQFYVGWVMEVPVPTVSSSVRILPLVGGPIEGEKGYVVHIDYLSCYNKPENKNLALDELGELGGDLAIRLNNIVSTVYYEDEFNQVDFGLIEQPM